MTKPTDPQLDALSRRIAEHMGLSFKGTTPSDVRGYDSEGNAIVHPDYARSLDSMHEAEKVIVPTYDELEFCLGKWIRYTSELCRLLSLDEYMNCQFALDAIRATAWQRAIALDRTLSKEPLL